MNKKISQSRIDGEEFTGKELVMTSSKGQCRYYSLHCYLTLFVPFDTI